MMEEDVVTSELVVGNQMQKELSDVGVFEMEKSMLKTFFNYFLYNHFIQLTGESPPHSYSDSIRQPKIAHYT